MERNSARFETVWTQTGRSLSFDDRLLKTIMVSICSLLVNAGVKVHHWPA